MNDLLPATPARYRQLIDGRWPDDATRIGAIINDAQLEKIERDVESARDPRASQSP